MQSAALLILLLACLALPNPAAAAPRHAIAMHGEPELPSDFAHLPYVNPTAPRGGRAALGVLGTFDSLNPFIVKGVPATGLVGAVFESLLTRGLHEPFTLYGLIAETVDVPDDRSSVTFRLRKEARFSDGRPITAGDVIFSHAVLKEKGIPNLRAYYAKVARTERLGDQEVRFVFADASDREMPLIIGLMPILPAHVWTEETFDRTTLDPPVGSGPYVVDKVEVGRQVVLRRSPDYWGRDLPVTRGRHNLDEVRYEYARDGTTLFEAFKTGMLQIRIEEDPVAWSTSYQFPAAADGRIVTSELPIGLPSGMTGLAFNLRRDRFKDQRVRRALILLFDFEWINNSLFNSAYVRTQSYFDRSSLSSHGKPASPEELAVLGPAASELKPEIRDGTHAFPKSDGSGHNRDNLRAAVRLLAEAGYALDGGKLLHRATRKPFELEILAANRNQERLLLAYAQSLKRIGIEARVRQVESAQYQARRIAFDFDMIQWTWLGTLSPGNEQLHRWSSTAARTDGSFNLPGVTSPAIDATIGALLEARDRIPFEAAVRALDRLLLSGDYVIPLFHAPRQWLATWAQVRLPGTVSLYGFQLDTVWTDRAE